MYRLIFVCLISCFAAPWLPAQNLVTNHQLLWQISGKGLKKPSYLFGSYHSNDSRIFKLSDSTFSALYAADAVVLEADIYQLFVTEDMRLGEANLKFDPNGKPYTSSNRASETKYGSEDGRPQFLDLYFQQMGYNMGKGFYALETIEDQIEALDFVYERSNAQRSLEDLKFTQDNLLNAYLRGDIEHVRTIIQNQMNHSRAAYDRLIVKRNVTMANGIDTLCRRQSLFIAVGAGHLAGEEGIIQLLRKKGYHVRQVVANYSEPKSDAEKKLQQFNSYTYVSKTRGFKAVFGGKPLLDTNVAYYRLIYQEMGQGNSYIIEIEDLQDSDLGSYAADVINVPEKSSITKVMHQGKIEAYEGIGYEYAAGLSWKRVFIVNGKLVKLICYGGNKFMNSNRPKNFFDKVVFE
ncbi:MAG: hypothetical protein K0R65_2405 [Crocinitomicaceae bacterium]|jgi:uncharacterized protein YbaP (TraB family)|nr:hypothetical protein [Crocinitomicaceae bacterium]